MNKVIEQWVADLESGKYNQGSAFLNKDDRFCCLGVLCEVLIEQGFNVTAEKSEFGNEDDLFKFVRYNGEEETLDDSIVDLLNSIGIDIDDVGLFNTSKLSENLQAELYRLDFYGPTSLAELNDRGASFQLIAKVIRELYDNTSTR